MNWKNAAFLVLFLSLVGYACQEIPPNINFEPDQFTGKDTTYVLDAVPAKDDQNVLIEDITGVRCPNCPEAAKVATELEDKYPSRVSVMTIHPLSIRTLTTPIEDTFNTQDGEDIFQQLIGGSPQGGLPVGAVNRKIFPGETTVAVAYQKWFKYGEDELALKSDVNLTATVEKVDGQTITLAADATFTETLDKAVFMTVALIESHIINPQSTSSGTVEDYEHNHILRDVITPYQGVKLADNVAEKGRVFERVFTFNVSEKYVLENCHLVVFINRIDDNSKEVLQVVNVPIVQ